MGFVCALNCSERGGILRWSLGFFVSAGDVVMCGCSGSGAGREEYRSREDFSRQGGGFATT